jgi:hypothetical protein
MEPEGSLPHSQVPTICPYPEPARTKSRALTIADVLFSTSKVCSSHVIFLLLVLGKYELKPTFPEVTLVFNI